ncbi:Zinc finger protein MAGPIE [Forsythia ovata]|uniref:Zinc finger protein MAGPIE n=1 Tax=Forsythia ovata TaxID=205694 RepID=A0ABD1S7V7_9LAMI
MTEEVILVSSTPNLISECNLPPVKKKRNLPGNPDPEAEVIALSPKTLMATNRFLCEICGKGFQRDQNLQLHRRGHNLPWKLKQRTNKEVRKRVFVCPEKTCVHHHPSRALGDLTGIKKHFCRKHGEKKWKCEKCSKRYAVQSDWKAHSKTCGTREYKCDCGTIFSRRDSFVTHRAFCDALAEETARVTGASHMNNHAAGNINYHFIGAPLGPNTVQNFSSIFKPISSSDQNIDPTRRGLLHWMGQGSQGQESVARNFQEMHHMGIPMSSGVVNNFPDPLVINSCSNPQQSSYQWSWDLGNNLSSNQAEELTKNSLPLNNIEDLSIPSLFSSQHQIHQPSSANMSATALLQKAAQIGATTTDPSFLGNFGFKCSENPVQNEKNSCGVLYGSNPVTSGIGSDVESSLSDLSGLNQLQMYPPSKRQHVKNDKITRGETRDFLGVGMESICHPSSLNGWI